MELKLQQKLGHKKTVYVCVLSIDQNEDGQLIVMDENDVPSKNIYIDKQSGKDLMGTFIADLVLQILSFVAKSERENIKKRQAQGIAAAEAKVNLHYFRTLTRL